MIFNNKPNEINFDNKKLQEIKLTEEEIFRNYEDKVINYICKEFDDGSEYLKDKVFQHIYTKSLKEINNEN